MYMYTAYNGPDRVRNHCIHRPVHPYEISESAYETPYLDMHTCRYQKWYLQVHTVVFLLNQWDLLGSGFNSLLRILLTISDEGLQITFFPQYPSISDEFVFSS